MPKRRHKSGQGTLTDDELQQMASEVESQIEPGIRAQSPEPSKTKKSERMGVYLISSADGSKASVRCTLAEVFASPPPRIDEIREVSWRPLRSQDGV